MTRCATSPVMELTELNGDPTIITSRESVPLMAEDIIGEEVIISRYTHTLSVMGTLSRGSWMM